MKPQVSDWVITFVEPTKNNGTDVCPAVITRVWSDTMVNVRTLNDSNNLEWKTSVRLFDTEEEARAMDFVGPIPLAAFWPPVTR
jgi:hypothetical protein